MAPDADDSDTGPPGGRTSGSFSRAGPGPLARSVSPDDVRVPALSPPERARRWRGRTTSARPEPPGGAAPDAGRGPGRRRSLVPSARRRRRPWRRPAAAAPPPRGRPAPPPPGLPPARGWLGAGGSRRPDDVEDPLLELRQPVAELGQRHALDLLAERLQLRPDRVELPRPVVAERAGEADDQLGRERMGHALHAGVVDRRGEVLRHHDVHRADKAGRPGTPPRPSWQSRQLARA